MNEAIELLLLQIATMCMHITANGQTLANCDISGHTHTVYVRIFKADTDFSNSETIRAGTVLATHGKYERANYDWLTPEEQQAASERELESVISQLMPYLHTEQLEAAA